jgi:hypothetical protein
VQRKQGYPLKKNERLLLPWREPDLLQEEEQVREPAGRRDVVQHVPYAVGQYRPPPQRLRLGHGRTTILCVRHAPPDECSILNLKSSEIDRTRIPKNGKTSPATCEVADNERRRSVRWPDRIRAELFIVP